MRVRARSDWERLETWLVEPDLSGNRTGLPGHESSCPGAMDGYRAHGLRVVSDPTLEPDVEVIVQRPMLHRGGRDPRGADVTGSTLRVSDAVLARGTPLRKIRKCPATRRRGLPLRG